MPLQSSHHLSDATAWDSKGSLRSAPGISAALRVTEMGNEELVVGFSILDCRVDIAIAPSRSFSVVLPCIFTLRTPFSRASSLIFCYLCLNRIYGTMRAPVTLKQLAQRFPHSLQYCTVVLKSNRI